ncbi:MAG: hypothetical protein AB7F89_03890 [Pirellulaceae bacterium]
MRIDVEKTLRGGHLLRIHSPAAGWIGLYRCDQELRLLAQCGGTPPRALPVSEELRGMLALLIR